MNLQDQVCSLELSKKLKELGVKQESVWYWIMDWHNSNLQGLKMIKNPKDSGCIKHYSAFTCAELGEIITGKNIHNNVYLCDDNIPSQTANTEANARAKMLIYLLEKGLL